MDAIAIKPQPTNTLFIILLPWIHHIFESQAENRLLHWLGHLYPQNRYAQNQMGKSGIPYPSKDTYILSKPMRGVRQSTVMCVRSRRNELKKQSHPSTLHLYNETRAYWIIRSLHQSSPETYRTKTTEKLVFLYYSYTRQTWRQPLLVKP